jgi:hypothetical protein
MFITTLITHSASNTNPTAVTVFTTTIITTLAVLLTGSATTEPALQVSSSDTDPMKFSSP